MNAKRQTVWLVSMLSLMVVLSAYYLFTEDVNKLEFTANGATSTNDVKISTKEHSGGTPAAQVPASQTPATQTPAAQTPAGKTDVKTTAPTAVDPTAKSDVKTDAKTDAKASSVKTDTAADSKTSGAKTDAATGAKTGGAADAKSTAASASQTDAKVLEKIQAQASAKSGTDFFVSQQLKRNEDMGKQTEQLMTIITDAKQNTDTVSKAYEDLRKLEDKEAKITNLEESLMKDFPQVLVSEDSGKWKVVVQSKTLERSQAFAIVDKVMNEMSVGGEKVSVQYMP